MLRDEFDALFKNMVKEEMAVLLGKGQEYTVSNEDCLANFKGVAADLGIDPLKAWYIFMNKHIRSIANYCKTGKSSSTESIEGRILDARNYLALGRAIIEEQRNQTKTT